MEPERGFEEATWAKNWITFFVFSVLPAPLSPVQRIDWSSRSMGQRSFSLACLSRSHCFAYLAACSGRRCRWPRKYAAEVHVASLLYNVRWFSPYKWAVSCTDSPPHRKDPNKSRRGKSKRLRATVTLKRTSVYWAEIINIPGKKMHLLLFCLSPPHCRRFDWHFGWMWYQQLYLAIKYHEIFSLFDQ